MRKGTPFLLKGNLENGQGTREEGANPGFELGVKQGPSPPWGWLTEVKVGVQPCCVHSLHGHVCLWRALRTEQGGCGAQWWGQGCTCTSPEPGASEKSGRGPADPRLLATTLRHRPSSLFPEFTALPATAPLLEAEPLFVTRVLPWLLPPRPYAQPCLCVQTQPSAFSKQPPPFPFCLGPAAAPLCLFCDKRHIPPFLGTLFGASYRPEAYTVLPRLRPLLQQQITQDPVRGVTPRPSPDSDQTPAPLLTQELSGRAQRSVF